MSTDKMLEIINAYSDLKGNDTKHETSINLLAKLTRVDWHTANKAVESFKHGISDTYDNRLHRPTGVGSKTYLSDNEESYLLYLRFGDPSRSNDSYVAEFYFMYTKVLSSSFITR